MAGLATRIPTPDPGREAAEAFVSRHLTGLFCDEPIGSERFRGGQAAADAALHAYDVTGYSERRSEVLPESRRGASALSPYIRHGLLPLRRVWDDVADGPSGDVRKFHDELLWQEFSRHWYARLGERTQYGIRRELAVGRDAPTDEPTEGWDRSMACMDATVGELVRDGWLVNQTRMWLSADWSVRNGWRWQDGEEVFFRHLLDGSRAANRLGWQWTTGVGSSKHYGMSRWQVEKRAPNLCRTCERRDDCPIQEWPDDPEFHAVERPDVVRSGRGLIGPASPVAADGGVVDAVWLTAESLGFDDPALAAHADVPAVFVFDRPLLERLQLSAKRLVFLVETLAELGVDRPVELYVGDVPSALEGRRVSVTHAPVPGFARHAGSVRPTAVHPWPWLASPGAGSVSSFSSWRHSVRQPI
jgi:deoxyribodipyrimidine photo-lyase